MSDKTNTPTTTIAGTAKRRFMETLNNHQRDKVNAVKQEYAKHQAEINGDKYRSELWKTEELARIKNSYQDQLAEVRAEQDRAVEDLKAEYVARHKGHQATGSADVLLRRDASERARTLMDSGDSHEVTTALKTALADALHNSDDSYAHALGTLAGNTGRREVYALYASAYPEQAGASEAVKLLDHLAGSHEVNLANSMAYEQLD